VILSFIEVRPLPGNREKILELLRFLVDSLETRRGCLAVGVYEADDEKGTILH
jgi:quinol monooxygenase YgiN